KPDQIPDTTTTTPEELSSFYSYIVQFSIFSFSWDRICLVAVSGPPNFAKSLLFFAFRSLHMPPMPLEFFATESRPTGSFQHDTSRRPHEALRRVCCRQ